MRSWTKRDYFTCTVLFIYLFVRFPIADFVLFLQQLFKPFPIPVNLEIFRSLQNHSTKFLHEYVYAFNNLAFFWINAPMISILLGIIVWRSKSITPSAIAHILINMLLGFVAFRNM